MKKRILALLLAAVMCSVSACTSLLDSADVNEFSVTLETAPQRVPEKSAEDIKKKELTISINTRSEEILHFTFSAQTVLRRRISWTSSWAVWKKHRRDLLFFMPIRQSIMRWRMMVSAERRRAEFIHR